MTISLTVIVPAYNEQDNIQAAIESVLYGAQDLMKDLEILVIDDGSTDQTAPIVRSLMVHNPKLRIFSNQLNQGYGKAFKRGIELAAKDYVTTFPGDNDMSKDSFREIVKSAGQADVVTSHMLPNKKRPLYRRLLSQCFVGLINFLFGLKLKYYNGSFICATRLLRSIPIKSDGMTLHAECLVRLIKGGCSYDSIGFEHVGRRSQRSKALQPKSIFLVGKAISVLWKDIYFSGHSPMTRA